MWDRASLFRRFTDTNVQYMGTGSIKMGTSRLKISVNVFLQCIVTLYVPLLFFALWRYIDSVCGEGAGVCQTDGEPSVELRPHSTTATRMVARMSVSWNAAFTSVLLRSRLAFTHPPLKYGKLATTKYLHVQDIRIFFTMRLLRQSPASHQSASLSHWEHGGELAVLDEPGCHSDIGLSTSTQTPQPPSSPVHTLITHIEAFSLSVLEITVLA